MRNYKISDYNIIVKSQDNHSYHILQGCRGNFDKLDLRIGEMLKSGSNEVFNLPNKTIEFLIKRGYVCDSDLNENTQMNRVAKVMNNKSSELYHISIIPTYECNFCCPYCYEKESGCREKGKNRFISKGNIEEFYEAIEKLGPNVDRNICLFGGEPLMEKNYVLIKEIVNQGYERGMKFYAASNGYDLDVYDELLTTEKINYLQLTLDGIDEYHDKSRFLAKGQPSFAKITSNIDWILKKGINVSIRTNISNDNFDQIRKLISFYAEKGWMSYDNFRFYFSPLDDCEEGDKYNECNHKSIINYLEENEKQINPLEVVGVLSKMGRRLSQYINNNKLVLFQAETCDSHRNGFLVDLYGDLYPCCNLVGTKFTCGKLIGGEFQFDNTYNEWNTRYVSAIEMCNTCKYALYCGGGCNAKNVREEKAMSTPVCSDFKELFEYCLARVN